jgi:hypothetical protein
MRARVWRQPGGGETMRQLGPVTRDCPLVLWLESVRLALVPYRRHQSVELTLKIVIECHGWPDEGKCNASLVHEEGAWGPDEVSMASVEDLMAEIGLFNGWAFSNYSGSTSDQEWYCEECVKKIVAEPPSTDIEDRRFQLKYNLYPDTSGLQPDASA